MPHTSRLAARWIWRRQESYKPYHQVILARKSFRLEQPGGGTIKIAVDGGYRLFLNGHWVADGPARSWPEHFQYDVLDAAPYLRTGLNELTVIARHWQVGDFHTRPRQAGLLVQLDLDRAAQTGGAAPYRRVISNESWQVAELPAWARDVPKVSIQMEPQELYDARLEDNLEWSPAAVLYPAKGGPWRGLAPRDVALLTRRPRSPRRFLGASLVRRRADLHFCLPAVRLASFFAPLTTPFGAPDTLGAPAPLACPKGQGAGVRGGREDSSSQEVEANHHASAAGGMVTLLELDAPAELALALDGMRASIDGRTAGPDPFHLSAGSHWLAAFAWPVFGHRKERSLRIVDPPAGLRLRNPLDPAHPNPWVYLAMPQFGLRENDLDWVWFAGSTLFPSGETPASNAAPESPRGALLRRYGAAVEELLGQKRFDLENESLQTFQARLLAPQDMFVRDTHWAFTSREVVGDAAPWVEDPQALMHDNAALTVIHPAPDGDIELAYDLGEQTVGCFEFELVAPPGVVLDLYAVEYISPDGRIQHTGDNHNGLRYITRARLNRFTSLKRRAGRYLFLTLRGLPQDPAGVVSVRLVRVIESTYPTEARGWFECSDAALGRVWQVSARTLELCMEDTFTDCPLYEQTLWVGDARNEAIFAFDAFGAADIARRCLRLAAQSLERYPLVGGQVPSSWDMLLPAWSFLWTIGVWDYYFYTGDRQALAELFPAVVRNLDGAFSRLDSNGLFSGKFWNMFDWSGIDDRHETVLHNSLLLAGALEAAQKMADVLGKTDQALLESASKTAHPANGKKSGRNGVQDSYSRWLAERRGQLAAAINRWWNPEKRAYPDSIHEDGRPSPSTCQHTSFLALLYGVIPPELREAALGNTLRPPNGTVRVGSPFAIMYLYEALARAGEPGAILSSIYENYLPMLEAGATTVWEVFPTSGDRPGGFPTRSHCHAWSSAPVHFLPAVVLGIRQEEPGGAAYRVSPWIGELEWAKGAVCTARGLLEVGWRRDGKRLVVEVRAPAGVQVQFESNRSMVGLETRFVKREA